MKKASGRGTGGDSRSGSQVVRKSAGEASASRVAGRLDLLMRTGSEEIVKREGRKKSIEVYVMATLP